MFAPAWTYLNLLSPQSAQLKLTLFLSECAHTEQFFVSCGSVFSYHLKPEERKIFWMSWDWSQVLLLHKQLLKPMSMAFQARTNDYEHSLCSWFFRHNYFNFNQKLIKPDEKLSWHDGWFSSSKDFWNWDLLNEARIQLKKNHDNLN